MATVIDALVITLGIDNKGFQKGQEDTRKGLRLSAEEARKAASEMSASGKRAAESFASIKTEVLGLVGALLGVGGMSMLVKKTTDDLAALGREAHNIGMAAPDLAAFRNMIERNGGSADAAVQSFRSLTDEMERFKVFGQSSIIQYLAPIGAQRGDSAMEVYQKFVRFAEAHKNDAPLINLVGRGLGLDQGSINEAMKGIAQVQKDLAESYNLGVPNDEQIKRATELQHDWVALRQAAENLANTIITNLEPSFHKLLTATTHLIEKQPAIAEIIAGLTALSGIRIVASKLGLTGVAEAIATIEAALGRVLPLLAVLGLSGDTPGGGDEKKVSGNEYLDYLRAHHDQDHPAADWMRFHMPSWLGGAPPVSADADETQSRFLQVLSDPESGGSYTLKNGGSHFTDLSHFPEGVGPGGTSTASGRYQFTAEPWGEAQKALGLTDFSPASQDRAAWWLADREYRQRTGRVLEADLAAGGHEAEIAAALNKRWPSLPGGSEERESLTQFRSRLGREPPPPPMNPFAPGYMSPAERAGDVTPPRAPWVPGRLSSERALLPPAGARQSAIPAPQPQQAVRPAASAPGATSGHGSTSVTVGSITVHSQATDAAGIARDLRHALVQQLVTQANRGLA